MDSTRVCSHCTFHGQRIKSVLIQGGVCEKCKKPQPLLETEDYFSVLSQEKKFEQDVFIIKKNFLLLSHALHPDRWVQSSTLLIELATIRMSFLNKAYETIKDSSKRRRYLIQLLSPEALKNKALSEELMDLASLVCEQENDLQQQPIVLDLIERQKKELEKKIKNLEKKYDETFNYQLIPDLANAVNQVNYLHSLEKKYGFYSRY